MASETDFPARGKVTEVRDGVVVFAPINTNYQLHLATAGGRAYDGPVNEWIDAVVRLNARKVMTVPSGGNFVEPIFGRPRTIQGRVKFLTTRSMVVQAGLPIVVSLPQADSGIDLGEGAIRVGSMVNVMALPGATIEPIRRSADVAPSPGSASTRPADTQPV